MSIKIHKPTLITADKLFELETNSQTQSLHEFTELRKSIKENGFDETLLVRPVDDKYEVVSGNHRYRAGVAEGMKEFPCVVQPGWDDTKAAIESVRRNYVRGKIDKAVFTTQANSIMERENADLEFIREQMGFEDEDALAEFYQGRSAEEEEFIKNVGEDVLSPPAVRLLDDLGNVLSAILAEYGATVPNSFIVFPAGGKHHIYVSANSALKSAVTAIAEKSVEKNLDINISLGGILQIGLAQTDFLVDDHKDKDVHEQGERDYGSGTDFGPIYTADKPEDEPS